MTRSAQRTLKTKEEVFLIGKYLLALGNFDLIGSIVLIVSLRYRLEGLDCSIECQDIPAKLPAFHSKKFDNVFVSANLSMRKEAEILRLRDSWPYSWNIAISD